jgi:hypothetical protein
MGPWAKFWIQRRNGPQTIAVEPEEELRRELHERVRGLPRHRSPSKRLRDATRLELRLERKRLFKEAFHDNINSLGEVDATTGSELLKIDRGDVLLDPKQRPYYKHPAFEAWWRVPGPELRARVSQRAQQNQE